MCEWLEIISSDTHVHSFWISICLTLMDSEYIWLDVPAKANIPQHSCGCFATNLAEVSHCAIAKFLTSPIEDQPDLHWIKTNQKHFWRCIRGPKLVTFPGVSLQNKYCVKGVRNVCWPCHLCVLVRRIGSRWAVLIFAFVPAVRSSLFGSRLFCHGSHFRGTCY